MAGVGDNFPTAASSVDRSGKALWNAPTSIDTADGNSASCSLSSTGSDYLVSSAYGFSIPAASVIDGIRVSIGAGETGSGSSNYIVQLSSNTTPTLIGTSKTSATVTGSTIVEQVFGGIADIWGVSLTGADVNASGFGVTLWSDDTGNNLLIDYIKMFITYTPPAGGGLFTAGGYYKVP